MFRKQDHHSLESLPACAAEFIKTVIKKMRYSKKVRQEVQAELVSDFEAELKDCKSEKEKEQKTRQLIEQFGDTKLLALLLRRAKKRCRPLWKKTLVRSLQILVILVAYLVFVGIYLSLGSPKININYVNWLNKKVGAGRDPNLNAKPQFDKAVKLSRKIPETLRESHRLWPGKMSEKQKDAVVKVLNENAEALDALKKGVGKPYYWIKYGEQTEILADDTTITKKDSEKATYLQKKVVTRKLLSSFNGYRKLSKILALWIGWRAYNGDIEQALMDCIVLQKLGCHLQGKGLLTEQLVGIAIEAIAHDRVFMVLQKTKPPAKLLQNLQHELENIFSMRKEIVNVNAEKAFWYDYIQRSFTDDGKGNGRMLKEGVPFAVGDWKDLVFGFVFFSFPDRKEVTKRVDRYFEEFERLFKETPRQLHNEGYKTEKLKEITQDCIMLKILAPAHQRVHELTWRSKTSRIALLTSLAVLRYEKDNGRYPAELNKLVETGYLSKLPIDPYSGKPLAYQKTETDFKLYSVGPNFIDDGGKITRSDTGKIKKFAEEADFIFWPAYKFTE